MEVHGDLVAFGFAGNASAFAGGGGSIGFAVVEVDLGTPAKRAGTFQITGLAGQIIGKPVQLWLAPGPYTGKGFSSADEVQMYQIDASGIVTSATTVTVYWRSRFRVRGNIKLNYLIGA